MRVPWLVILVGLACAPLAARAEPPLVEGEVLARLSVTVEEGGAAVLVPGPFAVFPDGRRVAVNVPEANGILLVEGDRILHHFPVPASPDVSDLAASDSILVAGRRPRGGPVNVELLVFDVVTGRLVQQIQSANPYLRAPAEGIDAWRIVVDGGRVGVFEPSTAATYPLWDRATGLVTGAEQVVRSTSGLGFGEDARWIPKAGGGVDRKVRGRSEPFASPDDGEFVGAAAGDVVVLMPFDAAAAERRLPAEIVVRVLHGEHAIAELRLDARSAAMASERLVLAGRPVRVQDGRICWSRLGPDYLEIRATDLPAAGD